ncbi:MAG: hypothetical protein ABIJ21_01135 [Nanoarchaeota archaeon]
MVVCQYFGRCGGCSLQHVPYESQLLQKKARVVSLAKRKNIVLPEVIVSSGREYGYRNRMDFIFHKDGLGLRKKGDWKHIVGIETCPIANEGVNKLLQEARHWFMDNKEKLSVFDVKRQSGVLKYCVVRSSVNLPSSAVSFVMNEDAPSHAEHIVRVEDFARMSSAENVVVTRVPKKSDMSISEDFFPVKGEGILKERIAGSVLSYAVQGFFQNNPVMAEQMVIAAREILSSYETENAILLDLFGGVGTFGIPLGCMFRKLVIFESCKGSVDCAKKNILENTVVGEVIFADAASLHKHELPGLLFVVVDPPRTGLPKKTIAFLLTRMPEVLLYVSCNPEELFRELPLFMPAYDIKSVRLFDLFPQTPHTEVMVELRKKE